MKNGFGITLVLICIILATRLVASIIIINEKDQIINQQKNRLLVYVLFFKKILLRTINKFERGD